MRIALAIMLATPVLASPAGAATVQLENEGPGEHGTVDGYALGFQAAPGEANAVTIATGPGGVLVRDTGAPLTAGPYCQPAVDGVTCAPAPGGALIPAAVVDLGDGDDRLTVLDLRVEVQDGPGDDVIEAPSATFDAGTGADTMRITNPAAASDVTYATRTAGVTVTEDGVANDGEPGEHDDVGYGIQSVKGGSGDDVLVAGQEPHILDGNAGNDRLVGGPRDDILIGDDPLTGAGDDVLLGGDGDDELLAWAGADVIRGGPGKDTTAWPHAIAGVHVTLDDRPGDGVPGENDDVGSDVEVLTGTKYDDVMVGSDGPQVLDGREGEDRLDGAGGPDQIYGGTGDHNVLTGGAGVDQIAVFGARDTIRTRDGERDSVGCGSPSSARQRFDVDPFDTLRFCASRLQMRDGQRPRLDRRGAVALAAHCPARRGNCAGSVRLARCLPFKQTIGRASFRVPEGRTRRVRVHLTRSARRLVARHHVVCAYATARTHRTHPPPSAVEDSVRLTLLA